jgi:putative protease
MGRVVRVSSSRIAIEAVGDAAPLKPGDGVVFDAADWRSPQEPEEGGRIYHVHQAAGTLELEFGNGAIDTSRIRPGDLLWRSHDPEIDKLVRQFTSATAPVHKQRIDVRVIAREGSPLTIEWTLPGIRVATVSDAPLGRAQNRALSVEHLREQLGRLGNTAYQLGGVELDVEGEPFAPSSMLNQLRRQAVERLAEIQAHRPMRETHDPLEAVTRLLPSPSPANGTQAQLHLLVRTPEQLDAALRLAPSSITLDYLDLYGLRPSLDRVKAEGIEARVASPRVLKPGEERIVDFLLRCDCPILVRSGGLIERLRGVPHAKLHGDFSLNAANVISASLLLDMGLDRIAPTHDLNAAQIATLAKNVGPERLEVVAYQHLPVFHTEHCVFCRFLSTGTSYRDCGRPCEKHVIALRDSSGRPHPVMADVGCRNTVFGAEAQEASRHLQDWLGAGIRHVRLEFVHETADQVTRVAEAFHGFLAGGANAEELHRQLRGVAPEGSTEGSLFVPTGAFQLPVLQ